jgi:hypothetical protein
MDKTATKSSRILQFAGIFWLLFGSLAIYFATVKIGRDRLLRAEGIRVNAEVTFEGETYRLKRKDGSYGNTYVSKPGPRDSASKFYKLSYRFEVPGKGHFSNEVITAAKIPRVDAQKVEVLYLAADPNTNDVVQNVEFTLGDYIFWTVGIFMWLMFFGLPGFGFIYAGRGRPQADAEKTLHDLRTRFER